MQVSAHMNPRTVTRLSNGDVTVILGQNLSILSINVVLERIFFAGFQLFKIDMIK